jgi:hypothetical protein
MLEAGLMVTIQRGANRLIVYHRGDATPECKKPQILSTTHKPERTRRRSTVMPLPYLSLEYQRFLLVYHPPILAITATDNRWALGILQMHGDSYKELNIENRRY